MVHMGPGIKTRNQHQDANRKAEVPIEVREGDDRQSALPIKSMLTCKKRPEEARPLRYNRYCIPISCLVEGVNPETKFRQIAIAQSIHRVVAATVA